MAFEWHIVHADKKGIAKKHYLGQLKADVEKINISKGRFEGKPSDFSFKSAYFRGFKWRSRRDSKTLANFQ